MSEYRSTLSLHLKEFLTEKRDVCGFTYGSQSRVFDDLDNYWFEHGYTEDRITQKNIEEWCCLREGESPGSLICRIVPVREFSKYLCGLGISSYIPLYEVHYNVPERHILTKPMVHELFTQIDDLKPGSNCRRYGEYTYNKYPILFRMIYLNGMRVTETCSLSMSQVDLDNGILTIFNGKGRKDRLVYMAEDLTCLCRDYVAYMSRALGKELQWLFSGRNGKGHISRGQVEATFNKCWSMTSFAETCAWKPTVHDLRHTMVCNRIDRWIEQGLDFEEMRPYLSKFLGHKTFRESYYYYHYSRETAKIIHATDKTTQKVMPEVKRI